MKSVDAVEAALLKITEIDSSGYQLNSVLALSDDALEQARRYDTSSQDLPLQGLPIFIKDNIEAVGLPATAGSLALADTPVTKDSPIAARFREAGAIIIGATNLSEWANIRSSKSTSGWSAVGGLTANPWKHGHSAGGSSSGSGAAVAAGLTQWAIGSETDGSIICPASLNGCVGIKPTVGAISREGMIPISASQDSPGPMTQTVEQAALLLDVLTGKSEYRAAAHYQNPLRIGVVKSWLTNDSGVDALFEASVKQLEKSGIQIVEVDLTAPESQIHEDEFLVLLYELYEGLGKYLEQRPGAKVKSLDDVVAFNSGAAAQELHHFGQELFEQALEIGKDRAAYLEARKRNLEWAEGTLAKGLADVDVLIGCTYGTAWKSNFETGDSIAAASWITTAPAIAGTPIGTIPMGLVDGLPVGLGFVSQRNHESKLIHAMANAERALALGILKPTFTR
jgi:amidase